MQPQEEHVEVHRTARFYRIGASPDEAEEVWFVLHGYGQLAEYFVRSFRVLLDDGHRSVVAPEGLSRFYLEDGGGRVGASWMTKADRLAEIDDYVAYLDALHTHLLGPEPQVRVHVLGFSQGAATACRWAVSGERRVDRLTCWGGGVPHDLDLEAHGAELGRLRLTLVTGTGDIYLTSDRLDVHLQRLDEYSVAYRHLTYDGGHRIEPDVLREWANDRP